MKLLSIILLFLTFATPSLGLKRLKLNCRNQVNVWVKKPANIVECLVREVKVKTYGETISSVRSMIPVTQYGSFYIFQSPDCKYVPRGISKHFKNIKFLVIAHSGLKLVTKEDLKTLTQLQNLHLDHNQLESIEKDLFMYNPEIRVLNLSFNRITTVAADVFKSLTKLDVLSMEINDCFDQYDVTTDTLEKVVQLVEEKCAVSDWEIPKEE